MQYNYIISDLASEKINSFYRNVAVKYSNTYSFELMCSNLRDAYDGAYKIENGLLRREPRINSWKGKGFMANTDKWYFLYHIDGDTIYVDDACHAQNMHESVDSTISKYIREYLHSDVLLSENRTEEKRIRLNEKDLRGMVGYVVRRILNEEYEEVGSVEFELGNGVKSKSVVSLRNKGGKQMYHIAEDDGCYVPYAQSLKDGKCEPTCYIFPEMFAAMKKLPNLPSV